jgi:hypothetical protein
MSHLSESIDFLTHVIEYIINRLIQVLYLKYNIPSAEHGLRKKILFGIMQCTHIE